MKCAFYLISISFISATIPKDICDSCVPPDQCPLFGNLSKKDQQLWMERFPCKIPRRQQYTVPSGFATTAKGDYVCCSNNIWGVESSGQRPTYTSHDSTDKIIQPNRPENSNSNIIMDPINQGPNYNDKYSNTNNETEWHPGREQNYDNKDYWSQNNNHLTQLSNDNVLTRNEYNRWKNNRNRFWNERSNPAENVGRPNVYNNDRNNSWRQDRRYSNENNYGTNQRPPFKNEYDHKTTLRPPYVNRRPQQPNNFNNQGYGNNQNKFNSFNPYPNPNPYHPNNNYRNDGNSNGQCERLTSFPPDPKGGCCGREVADDDRITDRNPHSFAPANIASAQYSYLGTDELWRLRDKKQKRTVAYEENNSTIVQVENRISGGTATEFHQYPWTVLLLTTFDYGDRQAGFNCGGSLISSKYVLSAGHCVYDKDAVVKSVEVYVAEYDKRTFPKDCKVSPQGRKCIENKVMYAENIILHPQYENENLINDISLIRHQGFVPYTEYIRPICLPSINIDNPQFSNLQFEVAGWGRNGQYRTDIKQSTVLHLVDRNECMRFYPMLTTKHLCAMGHKGEDTCKGDSGGPLMTLYRGRYYVAGVVSGKRADSPCGTAVPSLYTNVYHYLNWIRSNIRT